MTKLVVIMGATGKQGGSVVNAFIQDPSFKVRAVSRDPTTAAAKALEAKGVEVVQGDANDGPSLETAFQGANVIFAMTADIGVSGQSIASKEGVTSIVEEAYRMEKASGKSIVDAVYKTRDTLDLFIFSSLSAAKKLSNGRYQKIYHFDGKAETVEYLESTYPDLVEKTVALQMGMFATNIMRPSPLQPTKQPDGRFRILMPCSVDTGVPFIDPNHDPAIFVKALASQSLPAAHTKGKVRQFAGYGKLTTFTELTALLNAHLPLTVYFEETDMQTWADKITFIPGIGMELAEMWNYAETVGYFGGEQGGAIPITKLKLDSPPVTMEEYIAGADWGFLLKQA